MIREYTEDELYSIWLRKEGLAPSAALAGFHDQTQLRQMAMAEIRAWYARLLLNAPPHMLPVEDIAQEVECHYLNRNSALLLPPARYVRPVMLRMTDWLYNVYEFRRIDADAVEHEAVTILGSTPHHPHAYLRPDGSIEAYGIDRMACPADYYIMPRKNGPGPEDCPQITTLTAVVQPPEGQYLLDEALLFSVES